MVTVKQWGEANGEPVSVYTLTNDAGMTAKVTTFGAILVELWTPDKNGVPGDIVLGYDSAEEYAASDTFFGATVGRVGNRIAGGRFTLDGVTYNLALNDVNGANLLHGGTVGWNKKIWNAEARQTPDGDAVTLRYVSPDGDEGFPGAVSANVTYTVLRESNTLRLEYEATTDAATPINLTNHSYFNLRGEGNVLAHEATLNADTYTPTDALLIPTGEVAPVAETPFDFVTAHTFGERIEATGGDPVGYDHNFLRNDAEAFGVAATVYDRATGRTLMMSTTEPAFQLYSGNFLPPATPGKRGETYPHRGGFCLEAQHVPDAVNQPAFDSVILRPGETYRQRTEYAFGIEE